jgi:hypothetical protein
VDFTEDDRDYVTWDIGGISDAATGSFDLERSETWHELSIDDATRTATALFCGPGVQNPGFAVVVPTTSHVRLRITDGTVQRDLDGGFIRLVT